MAFFTAVWDAFCQWTGLQAEMISDPRGNWLGSGLFHATVSALARGEPNAGELQQKAEALYAGMCLTKTWTTRTWDASDLVLILAILARVVAMCLKRSFQEFLAARSWGKLAFMVVAELAAAGNLILTLFLARRAKRYGLRMLVLSFALVSDFLDMFSASYSAGSELGPTADRLNYVSIALKGLFVDSSKSAAKLWTHYREGRRALSRRTGGMAFWSLLRGYGSDPAVYWELLPDKEKLYAKTTILEAVRSRLQHPASSGALSVIGEEEDQSPQSGDAVITIDQNPEGPGGTGGGEIATSQPPSSAVGASGPAGTNVAAPEVRVPRYQAQTQSSVRRRSHSNEPGAPAGSSRRPAWR